MFSRSLKLRLLGLAVLSVGVALGVAGIGLTLIFGRHIDRRVADELQQRSLELVAALASDASGRATVQRTLADPRYNRPYGGAYWQVRQSGGPQLRSRSLWDVTLAAVEPEAGTGTLERLQGPDGEDLDAWVRTVTMRLGNHDEAVLVTVAVGRAEVLALRQSFAADTAVALAILGGVLALGAWVQAGVGLRPLATLRRRLAAVHRGQAGHVAGPFPDEVAPLVSDLNRLFDRQREQVVQARTGAGDLAHALKTPLTLIEGEALRLLQGGQTASAALLREQAASMRRHVDRVLARARIHGLVAVGAPSADLNEVVDRLFAVMRRLPRGEAIAWVNAVPAGTTVAMDGDDLAELLGNLVDNARKWARSLVRVSAVPVERGARVTVEDDGPGLPPSLAERIARGHSGSDAIEGSGLGLAIVADLLAAYGTVVRIGSADRGGCSASFEMPVSHRDHAIRDGSSQSGRVPGPA